MARQRGAGGVGGGQGDRGFLGRLLGGFRRRAREGLRRALPCESWFYRWEWRDTAGDRVASGVHSIIRPARERPQAVAQRARAQVRRINEAYLAQLAARFPGGRLVIARVEDPLPVSGPC